MHDTTGVVVVIDDDEADIAFLTRGFRAVEPRLVVVSSTDPFEAEALVREHSPDLIFVDLRMVSRSGLVVVESLRSDSDHDTRPAIMISSSLDPIDIRRSYAARANAYYVKPGNSEGYRALARTVVDHWLGLAKVNIR